MCLWSDQKNPLVPQIFTTVLAFSPVICNGLLFKAMEEVKHSITPTTCIYMPYVVWAQCFVKKIWQYSVSCFQRFQNHGQSLSMAVWSLLLVNTFKVSCSVITIVLASIRGRCNYKQDTMLLLLVGFFAGEGFVGHGSTSISLCGFQLHFVVYFGLFSLIFT